MKTCSKCKIEKELDEFNKNKSRNDGLDIYCKKCRSQSNKQYCLDNKNYQKNYYLNNKEKISERSKQYNINHKEEIKQYNINTKEYRNNRNKQYIKQHRQLNPLYRFLHNTRVLITSSFKRKGCKKNTKTELILGCTIEEFKIHIEKQFLYPMSLENHGLIWEIDHITPISSAKIEEDIITLNHYTNLRPLFKTTEIAEQYGCNIEGNRNKGASSLVI
jgi:hypothetical protein